jgi:hypothetical protein
LRKNYCRIEKKVGVTCDNELYEIVQYPQKLRIWDEMAMQVVECGAIFWHDLGLLSHKCTQAVFWRDGSIGGAGASNVFRVGPGQA